MRWYNVDVAVWTTPHHMRPWGGNHLTKHTILIKIPYKLTNSAQRITNSGTVAYCTGSLFIGRLKHASKINGTVLRNIMFHLEMSGIMHYMYYAFNCLVHCMLSPWQYYFLHYTHVTIIYFPYNIKIWSLSMCSSCPKLHFPRDHNKYPKSIKHWILLN